MPPIKHCVISQTKEIRISGVDILDMADLARRIFSRAPLVNKDNLPNVISSPVIERELNIREES